MRGDASMKMLGAAALFITVFVVLVAAACVASTPGEVIKGAAPEARGPMPVDTAVGYTVAEGASAGDVGEDLEALGIIRSGRQFQALVRLMGVGAQINPGDYLLTPGMSTPAAIYRLLVPEAVPVRSVTFPEGIRIEEMAVYAEEAGFGTGAEFLVAVENAVLPPGLAEAAPAAGVLPPGQRLQGYLFPDTYILPESAGVAELVALMIQTLDERFTPEMRQAALANGLDTHETLTLASIIEREAVISEERPLISGVFLNRIRAGDLIGADPTVQYTVALNPSSVELYGWWKSELTIEDLAIDSPYNTRKSPGLPPGPITNPGLDSIEAAANPTDTDYYYFVADAVAGDGSHRFAVTEAEHIANINNYGAP